MYEEDLAEIEAEFLNEEGWRKTTPLERGRVIAWMMSPNLEVLGAIHNLLFIKENLGRVTPPLLLEEAIRFRKHYYERCLREYSIDEDEGEWKWADWGFNAAHGAVYWFYELWKNKETPRTVLTELKSWLAQLVKEQVQEGLLATAIYDHLLSNKRIAKFFSDWQDDPELRQLLARYEDKG